MPKYRITDNASGRTMTVDRDSPPTEEQARGYFASAAPEIVAGGKNQMREQSARNLQSSLGLDAPVSTDKTASFWDVLASSAAPTAEEESAYWRVRAGENNVVAVSPDLLLVKTPKEGGGYEYRPTNKPGFDKTDIARMAGGIPSMISSVAAGTKFLPSSGVARASGMSALASQLTGSAQDIAFRAATGEDIQPGEIVSRRAPQMAVEFLAGWGLGKAADAVGGARAKSKAISNYLKDVRAEGTAARDALSQKGYKAISAADLAESMLEANPTSGEAGNMIAESMNNTDEMIRRVSERAGFSAAQQVESAANKAIQGLAASSKPYTNAEVGLAALGSAKKTYTVHKQALENELNSIYEVIAQDVQKSGAGKFFVSLNETGNKLDEFVSRLPRSDTGGVVSSFEKSKKTLDGLREMVGVEQGLSQMRGVRSAIGAQISGSTEEMFPGVTNQQLREIYGAISRDIDESVRTYSGAGADRLKAYNANYKNLVGSIEDNDFLNRMVNNGFQNPEEVVDYLANRAGSADWTAIANAVDTPTLGPLRRTVVNAMIGSEKVPVSGGEVVNLPSLARKIRGMEPETKTALFGNKATWELLERGGSNIEELSKNKSVFSGSAMPSMNDLKEVMAYAEKGDMIAGQMKLKLAISSANARRASTNSAILSQIRNGDMSYAAANPAGLVDALMFGADRMSPRYVQSVLGRLPPDAREEVGRAAFNSIFERSRDTTKMIIGTTPLYNAASVAEKALGTKAQREVAEAVLGPQRYDDLVNWTKWNAQIAVESARGSVLRHQAARLASVAPYGKLLGARLFAGAMEHGLGGNLIRGITPDQLAMFRPARLSALEPVKTAASIALVQKAVSNPFYGDYLRLMRNFTPDQQEAIDSYLLGQE